MCAITVAQAKEYDQRAQKDFGVPAQILMENAGRSVAEVALSILKNKTKVVVVCGVGNNGGDGLVAARHLANAGKKVVVLLIGQSAKLKAEPKMNLGIIKRMGIRLGSRCQMSALKNCHLIIDALFGLGLNQDVGEPYASVIQQMNFSGRPILSIDIPSGLQADSGRVLGWAVRPQWTVTFVDKKKGMNKRNSGRIIVCDIGIKL